jgi:hypothetical protein
MSRLGLHKHVVLSFLGFACCGCVSTQTRPTRVLTSNCPLRTQYHHPRESIGHFFSRGILVRSLFFAICCSNLSSLHSHHATHQLDALRKLQPGFHVCTRSLPVTVHALLLLPDVSPLVHAKVIASQIATLLAECIL